MHLHRYEKIWLFFGTGALIIFLITLGINAFATENHPPSHMERIDPKKVSETPPFDEPGVKKIGENTYLATFVAEAFVYTPNEIEVPVGKDIIFNVTSKDVIHSFTIVGTNVNLMVVPGHISRVKHTFKEPGSYLVICNEYCGAGHHYMSMKIEVVE